MILSDNGNIGLGESSPSERLHVSGNAIISGDISANDSSFNVVDVKDININGTDIGSVYETITNVANVSQEIVDLSGYTSSELSREISDLSNVTGLEISTTHSLLSSIIVTEISTLSSEYIRDILDLSQTLHTKINQDLSAVIGGAGPALDTLKELQDFVTDLSGDTVTSLVSKVADLSGRESTKHATLSTAIVTLDNNVASDISDLSSLTFNTITDSISTLSSEVVRDIEDLSSTLNVTISANTQSINNVSTGFSNRQLLIGKNDGTFQKATLTDGSGIDIENNDGEIIIKTALQVRGTKLGETTDVTHDNIHFITFDKNSGFTVKSDASGEATVGLGSHWKQLDFAADGGSVSGSSLVPSGEESLKFIAGNHIVLSSDSTDTPQSIKIAVSIDASLNDINSSIDTNSTNIVDLSNDTTTIINNSVTDLSNYTSSELNREISDLRSETVLDISDLSHTVFTTVIGDINTLSTNVSIDIQ